MLEGLRYINRPYVLKGHELLGFMQNLRIVANDNYENRFSDENKFCEEKFKVMTSVTKHQFCELFTYCDPVPTGYGTSKHVSKKDLLAFLYKMH